MDKSFELCNFVDDPSPLDSKIRSAGYKILLRESLVIAHRAVAARAMLHNNIKKLSLSAMNDIMQAQRV